MRVFSATEAVEMARQQAQGAALKDSFDRPVRLRATGGLKGALSNDRRFEQRPSPCFGFRRKGSPDDRYSDFDACRKVTRSFGLVVCRDVADDAMCCGQS
jgi:hypothetical protein